MFKNCCFEPTNSPDHQFFNENDCITFQDCNFIKRNNQKTCPMSLGEKPLSDNELAGFDENRIQIFESKSSKENSVFPLKYSIMISSLATIFIKMIYDFTMRKNKKKNEKELV